MSDLSLNVTDGFNISYYLPGIEYKSFIPPATSNTVDDYNLCFRFIASGGTPPYVYDIVGDTAASIGLVNRPRTVYYNEYADLTIIDTSAVFSNDLAGVKQVGVTCRDSEGATVSAYGTVTIVAAKTYLLNLYITGNTAGYFSNRVFVDTEMLGLKASGAYRFPRCYYLLDKNIDVNLTFTLSGVLDKNPVIKAVKKPGFFDFDRPNIEQPIWTLKGRTEALTKDKFYPFTLAVEDGPSGNKDIYHPIDLMFYIKGDPNV